MGEKKFRILDVATDLNIGVQEVIDFLSEQGISVKPISKIDEETHEKIMSNFREEQKASAATKKKNDDKAKKEIAAKKASGKDATIYEVEEKKVVRRAAPKPVAKPVPEKPVDEKPVVAAAEPEQKPEPVIEPVIELVAPTPPAIPVVIEPPVQPPPVVVVEAEPIVPPEPIVAVQAEEPPPVEPIPVIETVAEEPATEAEVETDAVSETPIEVEPPEIFTGDAKERQLVDAKFSSSENVGGLKVFGEIELPGKKRKKKFKDKIKDLNDQAKADKARQPLAGDKRTESARGTSEAKPAAKKPEEKEKPAVAGATPVKKTGREELIEKLQADGKKKAGKPKKAKIDEKALDTNIKRTLLGIEDTGEGSRQKFRKIKRRERAEEREREEERQAAEGQIVRVTEFASTAEFAALIGVTPKEVIEKCFKMGKFITINQRLDKETLELLAMEFQREIQFVSEVEVFDEEDDGENPEDLKPRAPVVTIMGHVDHGKTSLLDYIRRSNVVAGESGGITQHIGAYEVTLENGRRLTFLDTPGHEAFTAMRARGAEVTDIVILVVAADDSVMPQTKEAINHAKAAGVPIVVAINKIDKPEANPDKIRQQLSENGVLVEEWGGDYQCQEIAAKKGIHVRELLDKVLTQADLLDLKANQNENKRAKGVIIEAELDKGKGVVATVMVQSGILKVGDAFVAGVSSGRVRALLNERGHRLEKAVPSQPVRVLGFEGLPQSGDIFSVMESDREARIISQRRQVIKREQDFRQRYHLTLNELSRQIMQSGKEKVPIKELRVIVKADVDGSVEALADGLMKIQSNEVKVKVIHRGVGQITETDVLLAAASDAIIIGFRVRPNLNAKRMAEKEEIDIRFYTVIYQALEDVRDALEGLLNPEVTEEITATVEIRQVFKVSKIGNIAGCSVTDGKLTRDARVRLLRDGIHVFEGELESLKRMKDDVKEVAAGFECGLSLKNHDDIRVGDILEAFKMVETKRKLVLS
jgi:translation initiation factor IF-2